jgi:hypothetical protein
VRTPLRERSRAIGVDDCSRFVLMRRAMSNSIDLIIEVG